VYVGSQTARQKPFIGLVASVTHMNPRAHVAIVPVPKHCVPEVPVPLAMHVVSPTTSVGMQVCHGAQPFSLNQSH
jgi:hypothetical protein